MCLFVVGVGRCVCLLDVVGVGSVGVGCQCLCRGGVFCWVCWRIQRVRAVAVEGSVSGGRVVFTVYFSMGLVVSGCGGAGVRPDARVSAAVRGTTVIPLL